MSLNPRRCSQRFIIPKKNINLHPQNIWIKTSEASSSKKQRSTNLEPSLHQYMKRVEELQGLLGLGSVPTEIPPDRFQLKATRSVPTEIPLDQFQLKATRLVPTKNPLHRFQLKATRSVPTEIPLDRFQLKATRSVPTVIIPHGSTSNSSCSTCSKISYDQEMQQLCGVAKAVSKVLGPEEMMKFMLNTQQFVYTVDMFRDILQLLMETPDSLFFVPVNIKNIEAFMNKVGYQGVFDKIKEDYHSIKDDIPLVSVYTTGDVRIRGMLISNAFLTEEIHPTNEFKEYEMVFIKRKHTVRESSSPRQSHKITIKRKKPTTEAQENIAKVQEKLAEEEIEKLVKGNEDEESYASEFADSVLNDDVDDSVTRLEPGSHKENLEKVDDDEVEIEKEKKDDIEIEKEKKDDVEIEKEKKDDIEIEKEKKDDVEIEKEKNDEEIENEKNNDNVEETNKVVNEKDIFDDEINTLKDKMIVDKYINMKQQTSVTEASNWSKDMIRYFKDRWKEDIRKEQNKKVDEFEDVLENASEAMQNFMVKVVVGVNSNILKYNGCRIMVGWDINVVSIIIVYAANRGTKKRALWKELTTVQEIVKDEPWILLGFLDCVNMIEVMDVCVGNV
nr:hypothetical protein [Tanacetum cinerariifolium]